MYDEDCIITADIDLSERQRANLDFDVVGHYARPDVLQLKVNRKPGRSVIFED